MLTSIAGKDFVYAAGGEYILSAAEAEEYIRWGRAEKIDEPKQKPVKVQEVKATTRPIKKK